MSRRRGVIAMLLALVVGAGSACTGTPPQAVRHPVVIGLDLPLTGPQADEAKAVEEQVRALVEQAYGGRVEGLPVTLQVSDDSPAGRRDPLQGEANLRRLTANPLVLGVVGPLDSDVAQAEIPIATAADLALVSPGATSACLTKSLPVCDGLAGRLRAPGLPPSFFRVVPTDDLEGAALVQFATTRLGASRFAVGSDGQAYGNAMRDQFTAALKTAGHPAVFSSPLDPHSDTAVAAFLDGARAAGADAILFGGRGEGGACLVAAKLPAALGAGVPFLGGSALMGSACATDAGAASTGVYTAAEGATPPAALAVRAILQAIATATKAEGGNVPGRQQVRQALSHGLDPAFDSRGDLVTRQLPIFQGQAAAPGQPAWLAVGAASL